MSVVYTIDTLTKWLNENLCPLIKFKQPIAEGQNLPTTTINYINPVVFSIFQPASDLLPSDVTSAHPSIVVQIENGSHENAEMRGEINIVLQLSIWNPGIHKDDYLVPQGETLDSTIKNLQRSTDGWRDIWNFVDITMKTIQDNVFMGNLRYKEEAGMKFGPYKVDDAFFEAHPFYFAWIRFSVEFPLKINVKNREKLL